MHFLQRITAILLAAVMTVSPALACAGLCPDGPEHAMVGGEHAGMAMAGEHQHCADMTAETDAPDRSDCAGSLDCATAKTAKNQPLAAAPFASIDAPAPVFLPGLVAIAEDPQLLARRHLTPPAIGPPPAATPLTLKTTLRI